MGLGWLVWCLGFVVGGRGCTSIFCNRQLGWFRHVSLFIFCCFLSLFSLSFLVLLTVSWMSCFVSLQFLSFPVYSHLIDIAVFSCPRFLVGWRLVGGCCLSSLVFELSCLGCSVSSFWAFCYPVCWRLFGSFWCGCFLSLWDLWSCIAWLFWWCCRGYSLAISRLQLMLLWSASVDVLWEGSCISLYWRCWDSSWRVAFVRVSMMSSVGFPSEMLFFTMMYTGLSWCSLEWRHNERYGVSNHWRLDCFLSRLFRRRLKKTSKFRVTGLCGANSPVMWPVSSSHEGPVTRKMFRFDDVIMF